jgi:hypothetical protein
MALFFFLKHDIIDYLEESPRLVGGVSLANFQKACTLHLSALRAVKTDENISTHGNDADISEDDNTTFVCLLTVSGSPC